MRRNFNNFPYESALVVSALVCAVVAIGYGLAARNHIPVKVVGFEWERRVQIQRFQTVSYSNVSYIKSGAYNVVSRDEGRMVFDYDSSGNLCVAHWEADIRYCYLRDEWRLHKEACARGTNKEPHWPTYQLEIGPLGVTDAVCATPERYIVILECSETTMRWETNYESWNSYYSTETVIATVNGFGQLTDISRTEDTSAN